MSERKDYRTKQRDAVEDCFSSRPSHCLTADEVFQLLKDGESAVGRTTVYRTIARLYQKGRLISFTDQHTSSPLRYQFREKSARHISVHCSACGMVAALDCEVVSEFEQHLSLAHGFTLSQNDCLLPGLCSTCRHHLDSENPQTKEGTPPNIMKTLILLLVVAALLLPQAFGIAQEEKLSIIATNFPAFDFAREIAGERATVHMLLPPGAEAHSYEPSPRDLVAIHEADLLIYNGGRGDYWVGEILSSFGADAPANLAMMDSVETVSEELVPGMEALPDEHQNQAGAEENELDEHVWTSPQNAIRISASIANRLIELDPQGTQYYQDRLNDYTSKLKQIDTDFRFMISQAKRRTIVLGDRFPMRYFTKEYGLEYYAAFPGCSAQTEPSARTLAFLMDRIREEKIPVVFYIEFSSQRSSNIIAAETGAKPLLLHSAHNVSLKELDSGISYLTIMQANLINLKEALN